MLEGLCHTPSMVRFIWRGVTSRPKLVIWLLPWWCCTLRKCPSGPPAMQGTSIDDRMRLTGPLLLQLYGHTQIKSAFMADHSYVIMRTCLSGAGIWSLPFMAKEGYLSNAGVSQLRLTSTISELQCVLKLCAVCTAIGSYCYCLQTFVLLLCSSFAISLAIPSLLLAPYLMHASGRLS